MSSADPNTTRVGNGSIQVSTVLPFPHRCPRSHCALRVGGASFEEESASAIRLMMYHIERERAKAENRAASLNGMG